MIKIKDYFRFNSRERLAIILLCCLMGLFWILPEFYPDRALPIISDKEKPHTIESVQPYGANAMESAYPSTATNMERGQPHEASEMERESAANPAPPRVIKYFYFDPNSINASQWQQLGISSKTTNTILNYRNKGGQFRKPDDLRKIWGLKPADADLLIPYVQIAQSSFPERGHPTYKVHVADSIGSVGTGSLGSVAPGTGSFEKKQGSYQKININTATQEEWERFPGIGPVLAARIIKFRDKMGGFKKREQVGKTYGLPDSVFQKILPYLEMDGNEPIK